MPIRQNLIPFLYAAVTVFLTLRYSYQIVVGEIDPVLTTWLIFFFATSLGLFTYLKSGREKTAAKNIGNTVDVFFTASVSLVLIWKQGFELKQGTFEISCFVLVALILLFYWVSRKAAAANLAVNALMVLAYTPTFVFLWGAKKNPESFLVWGVGCIIAALLCLHSIKKREWLPVVYTGRGVVLSIIVMLLMLRAG